MFSSVFVCLFVHFQDCAKTVHPNFTKFGGKVVHEYESHYVRVRVGLGHRLGGCTILHRINSCPAAPLLQGMTQPHLTMFFPPFV